MATDARAGHSSCARRRLEAVRRRSVSVALRSVASSGAAATTCVPAAGARGRTTFDACRRASGDQSRDRRAARRALAQWPGAHGMLLFEFSTMSAAVQIDGHFGCAPDRGILYYARRACVARDMPTAISRLDGARATRPRSKGGFAVADEQLRGCSSAICNADRCNRQGE